MLRRRTRPHTTPAPRPPGIRVLAGVPAGVQPVSADLLPTAGVEHRRGPAPIPAPPATRVDASLAARLGAPTVEQRADHIRAMARAAARRVAAIRR